MSNYLFTSESVTSGHPDKMCDLIADSILDAALSDDPNSHMAVEATIKDDLLLIYGEASTKANLDYAKIAREVIKNIGYEEEYKIITKVSEQSIEINNAVNQEELGAGDQGIIFGFANNETKSYMPFAIDAAHLLAKRLEAVRKSNNLLKPDGKTQVTVEYENDVVKRIDTVLISTQHSKDISQEEIYKLVKNEVIDKVISPSLIDDKTNILVNPSGSFIVGGSFGDSGTTGRKIVVDSYGGYAPIGGGCFSSKDPTKVDRSAAYYARYVARNIIANNLAEKCLIQLAYAIGKPGPISLYIQTYNTSKYSDEELKKIILNNFNFSVSNIINELDLRRPIYASTTNYGHFGKPYLPWEQFKEIKI